MSAVAIFGGKGWWPWRFNPPFAPQYKAPLTYAADIGLGPLPYVVITVQQASKFYWLLEKVTLTPTGTCTADYVHASSPGLNETTVVAFASAMHLPDLSLDSPGISGLSGNLGTSSYDASDLPSEVVLVPRPPMPERSTGVLEPSTEDIHWLNAVQQFTYGGGKQAYSNMRFHVRCVGGEYRLYYSFYFSVTQSGDPSADLIISSSEVIPTFGGTFEVKATGSFTFLGLTIPWSASAAKDMIYPPETWTYTLTGVGITVSDETYYTPI